MSEATHVACITCVTMNIVNLFWKSKSTDKSTNIERGWKRSSIEQVTFKGADAKIYITACSGMNITGKIVVDQSIIDILESSIKEFVIKDYPFSHIDIKGYSEYDLCEWDVDLDGDMDVICKQNKSDTTSVSKKVYQMGRGITLHTTIDVMINDIHFDYKEIDGQLINGGQCIYYGQTMAGNIREPMLHWERYI